jgi:hypothetical protein
MPRQVLIATGRSGSQIDSLALSVVKRYQPEMLTRPQAFEVERFFELDLPFMTGIATDYQTLAGGVHAYTDINEMVCVVSLDLVESPRQYKFLRSTLSHEIGHCHMHVPEFRKRKAAAKFIQEGPQTLRLYREDVVPVYANPEWQAWRYAGALMMPRESILIAASNGASRADMANIFEVHEPFVETRLKALGLVNKIKAL